MSIPTNMFTLQLEIVNMLNSLVNNSTVSKLSKLIAEKYRGCEYAHIFLAAEDEEPDKDETEQTDTDFESENTESTTEEGNDDNLSFDNVDSEDDAETEEEKEPEQIERSDPKELARTLRMLNHRLKQYRESVANMSTDINERMIENIQYLSRTTKDLNMQKYATKTPLPAPDDFIKVTDATDEVLDALINHNVASFLADAKDPKEIDLFDNVFTNRIKDLFAEIGVVKTEAGMPSFEGFEKIKFITSDGSISDWLEHLDRLTKLVERFSLEKSVKYMDKLSLTINGLINGEKTNEHIYPSLNLLITTVQQMVLVELSAKSYLMRVISKIKSSMKVYAKSLDDSDVLLTS